MKSFNMTYKLMKRYRLDHARQTKSNTYKQEKKDDKAQYTHRTTPPNTT